MNLLDIIIIVTMIFLIVRGIFRGFFRETGSLTGVVLGIWFANLYQPEMTGFLKAYLPSGKYLPLISFALIFCLILIVCNLLGWAMKLILQKFFFGWADRMFGACLAVLKGVIITYLVIVLLTFFVPSKTPLIAESKLAPLIISSYQSIAGVISPGSYRNLRKKFLLKKKGIEKVVSDKVRNL